MCISDLNVFSDHLTPNTKHLLLKEINRANKFFELRLDKSRNYFENRLIGP